MDSKPQILSTAEIEHIRECALEETQLLDDLERALAVADTERMIAVAQTLIALERRIRAGPVRAS